MRTSMSESLPAAASRESTLRGLGSGHLELLLRDETAALHVLGLDAIGSIKRDLGCHQAEALAVHDLLPDEVAASLSLTEIVSLVQTDVNLGFAPVAFDIDVDGIIGVLPRRPPEKPCENSHGQVLLVACLLGLSRVTSTVACTISQPPSMGKSWDTPWTTCEQPGIYGGVRGDQCGFSGENLLNHQSTHWIGEAPVSLPRQGPSLQPVAFGTQE